ncbi:MAG: DoxX family protein [Candidatus Binatia bacterium]
MSRLRPQRFPPWAPLVMRLALGVIFVAHGGQKLFGLWGGVGLSATMETFEKHMGIPPFLTVIAAASEFFGGLAVLVGFLTRPAALALGTVMLVALFKAHLSHGFFMNWGLVPGRGHGIEFDIALLALSIALLLTGPGKGSLDSWLGFEKKS